MTQTLQENYPIAAIQNGTAIDHIPAGQGMRIFRLLNLQTHREGISVGLNLPSGAAFGKKDIIKVEGREITEEEASRIGIFAPSTTVSIIRGGHVTNKFQVPLPKQIDHAIICPNTRCITNFEKTSRRFNVLRVGKNICLCCHYCERTFAHDEINEYEV